MQQYTDQQLFEKYDNLPEDLQEMVFSDEISAVVQEIGGEQDLIDDKIKGLNEGVNMVLFGIVSPNDFISDLTQRLGIDNEIAVKIAQEVDEKIFSKVQESLKKVHNVSEWQIIPPKSFASGLALTPGVGVPSKLEILAEIEREHGIEGELPAPPTPTKPGFVGDVFEAKTKDIFRLPPEEKKYKEVDPYREPVE